MMMSLPLLIGRMPGTRTALSSGCGSGVRRAEPSECTPLVGMALLHGYHLFVEVVDGGEVLIQARP
jgi:hypothetical protein